MLGTSSSDTVECYNPDMGCGMSVLRKLSQLSSERTSYWHKYADCTCTSKQTQLPMRCYMLSCMSKAKFATESGVHLWSCSDATWLLRPG